MSKGAILIARNNGRLDYVKQAVFLAKRIREYLDLPTSIVTDSSDYLKNNFDCTVFDQIIEIPWKEVRNTRLFFDGSLSHKTAPFKNDIRDQIYDLTPYDETLLLDTDYIISNNLFKSCFDSNNNIMMFKDSYDIAKTRNEKEFKYISDYSVEFYWATVVFFRKTPEVKLFFDLVKHVKDEWNHYRRVYQIGSGLFRNDFAFSIAAHIMNGFDKGDFVQTLPGKHYYTIDKDVLWQIKDDEMMFLIEKKDYLGEYLPIKTKGQSVHVMNKFSLERVINEVIND
jgi:hypothetical protein